MMTRSRPSTPRSTKKTSAATTADVAVADAAPEVPQKKTEAPSLRRRRTGRKASSTKARVPAVAGGWSAAAAEQVAGQRVDFGRIPAQGETWRAAERMVAATA
ncbi:hypothetical protein ONZ51_g10062 [Trametes cubensis]|uniref:Uncharacterized protein n=1 Tax=Trametes cubensis TaxID=1111947 RepID=A0AAD7X562_9APHY|nr:hypothetical protein ONZ51_g10062 [Trametes cubensis]